MKIINRIFDFIFVPSLGKAASILLSPSQLKLASDWSSVAQSGQAGEGPGRGALSRVPFLLTRAALIGVLLLRLGPPCGLNPEHVTAQSLPSGLQACVSRRSTQMPQRLPEREHARTHELHPSPHLGDEPCVCPGDQTRSRSPLPRSLRPRPALCFHLLSVPLNRVSLENNSRQMKTKIHQDVQGAAKAVFAVRPPASGLVLEKALGSRSMTLRTWKKKRHPKGERRGRR